MLLFENELDQLGPRKEGNIDNEEITTWNVAIDIFLVLCNCSRLSKINGCLRLRWWHFFYRALYLKTKRPFMTMNANRQ